MRYFLLSAILLLGALLPANASPACTTQSAATYANLAGGCLLSNGTTDFILKNINWTSVTGGNHVSVAASQVMLNPTLNAGFLSVAVFSAMFNVTGNQRIEGTLSYLVDPPPPILEDLNLEMDANSPVAPGTASVSAHICAGDLIVNNCVAGEWWNFGVHHFGPGNAGNVLTNRAYFTAPRYLIDVQLKFELDANGASSQINGVNAFTQTIPEPAAMWLMLGGLAGLLGARRIRRGAKLKGLPVSL